MYACRNAHVDTAARLLDLGASLNILSGQGRSALMEATARNHTEVVQMLISRETPVLDINAVNPKEFNRTSLMLAAHLGYTEIVKLLMQHSDVDLNCQDEFGYSALSLAIMETRDEILDLLLTCYDTEDGTRTKADVNLFESLGRRTPLILAAERNNSTAVTLLLRDRGLEQSSHTDLLGGTAMLRAIDTGSIEALKTMLAYGVDLRCVDDDKRSLLHGASIGGHAEITRLLLREGLDPGLLDNNNVTPLHDACRSGSIQTVQALLDFKADQTVEDNFGRTPLQVAWQYGHPRIMTLLGDNRGSSSAKEYTDIPNAENLPIWAHARLGFKELIQQALKVKNEDISQLEPTSNNTALHCAIQGGHIEIVSMLLHNNQVASTGRNVYLRTPLHLAALLNNHPAVILLIDHYVRLDPSELDVKDRWGYTASSLAWWQNHRRVTITLVGAGAQIDTHKVNVQKLFFVAVKAGSVKAVEAAIAHGADAAARDDDGMTGVQVAIAADDEDMVVLLRSNQSFYYSVGSKEIEDISERKNAGRGVILAAS